MTLTLDENKLLSEANPQQLAEYWCTLNRKERVVGLRAEPWDAMCWIMNKIGLKACLREWNKDTMDDEQFESFWNRHNHL